MKVKIISRLIIVVGLLLAVLPTYINAASLQYQASTEVEEGLKTGELSSEFDFYFSGSRAEPHTIIGVLKTATFDQSLWQGTDSSQVTLQKWYQLIDNPHRGVRDQYFGGYILDNNGQKIGLWYSKHRYQSASINEEGVFHISRPFKKGNVPGSWGRKSRTF